MIEAMDRSKEKRKTKNVKKTKEQEEALIRLYNEAKKVRSEIKDMDSGHAQNIVYFCAKLKEEIEALLLHNFYFTFGSNPDFPYPGGYLIVKAFDLNAAIEKYRAMYPDVNENVVNCAFFYSENEWKRINASVGECWEIIE